MIKKIIERIFKVINIIINSAMGFVCVTAFMHYGTNGYMYSDDILRLTWIVVMALMVNILDVNIRNKIKDF